MTEPRTRVLFLGSHLRSFHCLRYLLTQVPQAQLVGIVPHFSNTGVREDQRVEALAATHGVPYLTYEDIAGLDYDLGISLLFDRKLPPAIVDAPPRGFVNIHMAPLPRFRGANGVMHALLKARQDGVWTFGVTLHYIDHELDTGPIIAQRAVQVELPGTDHGNGAQQGEPGAVQRQPRQAAKGNPHIAEKKDQQRAHQNSSTIML